MNILFLDVDGPLIPLRLHETNSSGLFTYKYYLTGSKVMDAYFIEYLNEVLPAQNYKIVFNTAHNQFGKNYILNHAEDNGFNMDLLHNDLMTKYPEEIYSRMGAIEDWLKRNDGIKNWIVIDDVYIADGINHIRPSLMEGMTPEFIKQLDDMLVNNTF